MKTDYNSKHKKTYLYENQITYNLLIFLKIIPTN